MTARPAPAATRSLPEPIERLFAKRIDVNWELVAYLAIFAAAFALRFWDLGSRALHHDESIHAKWAWDLSQGNYRHSPVFHGPLLYFVQGFTFLVFTATDYTARISPAIFGMAVAAMPLALRRWLGPVGTIAAVAFIAFSPTVVYYSRFLRMDIYLAFFMLLMVVAMWRYLEEGRARWLVVFAVGLAFAFSTKEVMFLVAAMFLLYLNGHLATDLAQATLRDRGTDAPWRRFVLAAAYFPYAWAAAALWPFLGRLRRSAAWGELPRPGDLLILTGTLTLPLLAAFGRDALEAGLPGFRDLPLLGAVPILGDGVVSAGRLDYPAVCSSISASNALALGGVFAVLGGAAAFVGLQWKPRTWLIAAGAAVLIYTTLMTSFWTNFEGLCTGPWGSLDYWRAQQDVRRGGQPWFYYLMLMPAYEFLPLALALIGGWWAVVRGNAFSRFLVFWFVAFFAALSFAGEKMPWLNTHLAIPAALLAAWTLQQAWSSWHPRSLNREALLSLAVVAIVAGGALPLLVYDWGVASEVVLFGRTAIAGIALAVIIIVASRLGRPALPVVAAVALIGALAFFSLRTMVQVVYERGDVPEDLLIYTQSSPDITRLADDIDRLAVATGRGLDLRIAVDSRDSFAWPWVWYLRDYRGVSYVDMEGGLPNGEFDVLLVNQANAGSVNEQLASSGNALYGPPSRYPHRWWFPETYKSSLRGEPLEAGAWREIGNGFFGGGWAGVAFAFWRDHDAPQEIGSIDGFAYFPANFYRETGRLATRTLEPVAPGVDAAGRTTFGGLGARSGEFFAPVDIEADAAGNLYVIDRTTRKLQKFDAAGNFLAAIDIRGEPGEASEPWGLEVAPDGRVFVADTFGWRILAFDSGLQARVLAFGQPPLLDGNPPGPLDLFGPRDMVIDAAGNLWVTDTGHHRLVVYTAAGDFIREIGAPFTAESGGRGAGPGEFSEPVGIDIAPNGEILVADMWNARVQILDANGVYAGEFAVAGWGGFEAIDKPYLRALSDGRIALALPLSNEVRIYSRGGELLATIAPEDEPLRRPYGIVEAPDGKLWIAEGEAARVRLFAIP